MKYKDFLNKPFYKAFFSLFDDSTFRVFYKKIKFYDDTSKQPRKVEFISKLLLRFI